MPGFTGFMSGQFDFSQVTGMERTFQYCNLSQPELLYAPGSFGNVTNMAGCWNQCLASTHATGTASLDVWSFPAMDLSSVTDIRAGFRGLFYNRSDVEIDTSFFTGLNLSGVVGAGLEQTFLKAFDVDMRWNGVAPNQGFTMSDLGLNTPNGITSLKKSFANNQMITGIPLMNTSNVTNWERAFSGAFHGWHAGQYGVVSGAPLNIEDGVTGLVFPAFDTSAGTGFDRAFSASDYSLRYNKTLGFMSRDFSSAVDLGGAFLGLGGWYADLNLHPEWSMPDTPSGHFPSISVSGVRSFTNSFSSCSFFDVFPEIDMSSAWSINCAWGDNNEVNPSYLREIRSWNFPNIDDSNEWKYYPGTRAMFHAGHSIKNDPFAPGWDGGAAFAFYRTPITGFPNGLHLGNPTGLHSTFRDCSLLPEVPDLTAHGGGTSKVETFENCFLGCSALTGISFPINMSSCSRTPGMFRGATSLQQIPEFVGWGTKVTGCASMFRDCITMSGRFSQDMSACRSMSQMFEKCRHINDLGDIDCSSCDDGGLYNFSLQNHADHGGPTGLNLHSTEKLNSLQQSFYLNSRLKNLATGGAPLDFTNVESAELFMYGCHNYDMAAIPVMTFDKCNNFYYAWSQLAKDNDEAHGITWPAMDYGTGKRPFGGGGSGPHEKTFFNAWATVPKMETFSAPLNDSFATTGNMNHLGYGDFYGAFGSCTGLRNFPANVFDNCAVTGFSSAFTFTSLTAGSIENIMVSIDTAGQSNGELDFWGHPGYGIEYTGSADYSTWTAPTLTALANLSGKGWHVSGNGLGWPS